MTWVAVATGVGTAVGGALGGAGAKSSGSPTMPTPQSNISFSQLTPTPAAMPGYGFLAGNMQNMMQSPVPYFPGQTYVSPSQFTQQGMQQAKSGLQAMQGYYPMQGQNYNFLSQAANVAQNPYVQAMMRQNEQSATDWLNNKALPGLQSGAIGVNSLGSDRLGLAQGQAAGEAQKNLLAQNAQTQMNAYGQGLNAQQYALGQTGNILQNLMLPTNTMLGLGKQVEGYQQAALQDQMDRFKYMYQEPQQRMQMVQGILGALSPLGIQQGGSAGITSQANPGYMSSMQGILGGAGIGGGLGQAIGGLVANNQQTAAPLQPAYGSGPGDFQMGGMTYQTPAYGY